MSKTYLVMAGGTGGHVYPALATAQELMRQGDQVVWLGSTGGFEQPVIEKAGLPFNGLSISGLRGKGIATILLAPFKLTLAIIQALSVIRRVKPDCVLGMGGFASGPGGLAAKLAGVPLVIHEQNAVAGMTNRYLAKVANTVLEAFPNSFGADSVANLVGNPLRSDISNLFDAEHRAETSDASSMNLLVLGGSLGAQKLNEVLPEALAKLSAAIRPTVKHQSGKNKHTQAIAGYQENGVKADVVEFVEDMGAAYEWADIVVCRAGALTLSELCITGTPAVLVPYPHAVDDHQTKNAQYLVDAGAAYLAPQGELTAESLAGTLEALLSDVGLIQKMSRAAKAIAKPQATEQVADYCRRLAYV